MPGLYDIELGKAGRVLAEEMLSLKKGETVVITADTETDMSAVDCAAGAVFEAGAIPLVVKNAAPHGVSMAADPMLPIGPLSGCLSKADVWLEFNRKWILYSTPYYAAFAENPSLRHVCLTGVSAQTMVHCLGRINYAAMGEFEAELVRRLAQAKQVRMTSAAGCDIDFEQVSGRPVLRGNGRATHPGTHFMAGQLTWTPELASMNGTVVLDGSIAPVVGVLTQPVTMRVNKGEIVRVDGGRDAASYLRWMESFAHPQMLRIAHAGLGFNPGAQIVGEVMADQRVMGSATWGVGSIGDALIPGGGVKAPSHSDAVSLDITVWLDDEPLVCDGVYVDKTLGRLAGSLLEKKGG